ncbi:MAG: DUF115 domain-containing protein [Treponema sp.]|jgi:hypothetical protein|nr:DUF115 domain-containing protein [Treponema sp.]
MSFLEANLALLRSRYPALGEQFFAGDGAHSGGRRSGLFRVERAASGDPTLVYAGNSPEDSGAGVHIHSQRDPVREGRRQAAAASASKEGGAAGEGAAEAIILLGFGLGYTAEALAADAARGSAGKGRTLIVLERRRELFRLALESRDLRDLLGPGKAVFIFGPAGESPGTGSGGGAVTAALALLEKSSPGIKPLILKNRALVSLTAEDAEWYGEVERRIQTWTSKDEINAATLRRFGKRWTRNLGANLSGVFSLPGVGCLAGLLRGTGIPVFLAAAGPSLNDMENHLEEIARRCVTVAVDTSLRFLVRRGIQTDFAVSVDPQYWNALHLHRISAPQTTLIAESAVYPSVLRRALDDNAGPARGASPFKGVMLCRSLFPLGRFIEDRTDPKGALGAGGSVATTAWDFARLLGPEAVWIAGLDLAFPGYRTHFRGALFEENAHDRADRFHPAETLSVQALESGFPFPAPAAGGGAVLTDRRLSLYAAWFENRLGEPGGIASRGLSPGGLAIPGLAADGVEQLLALPPRRKEIDRILREAQGRIDEAFFAPGAQAERRDRYDRALESLIRGLEEIRDRARQARREAENGLRDPALARPGGGAEKLLRKLDEANRAIQESPVKDAAGFLFPPPAELERELSAPPSEPLKRHLEFSSLLYRSLAEAANFTLKTLLRKP